MIWKYLLNSKIICSPLYRIEECQSFAPVLIPSWGELGQFILQCSWALHCVAQREKSVSSAPLFINLHRSEARCFLWKGVGTEAILVIVLVLFSSEVCNFVWPLLYQRCLEFICVRMRHNTPLFRMQISQKNMFSLCLI